LNHKLDILLQWILRDGFLSKAFFLAAPPNFELTYRLFILLCPDFREGFILLIMKTVPERALGLGGWRVLLQFLAASGVVLSQDGFAQGCMELVPTTASLRPAGSAYLRPGEWLGTISYRWVNADSFFVGGTEIDRSAVFKGRDIHFIDLSATFMATKRASATLTLPFKYGTTTAIYGGAVRFDTQSAGGLGDINLIGRFWLLDPAKQLQEDWHHYQNISLGLGVRFPTGDYEATSIIHRTTGPVYRPVHPALQPGTGGWGIILELDAFKEVFRNGFAYAAGSYLISTRQDNGVEMDYGDLPDYPKTSQDGKLQAVPDNYVGILGLSYVVWPKQGLSLTLGGRVEGQPVYNLVTGSDGYRPAGYAISIEPGLVWTRGRSTFTLSAPVAIERNREANVPNLRTGTHYGAAFADFLILASYSHRF
jgi:hypothetical protein